MDFLGNCKVLIFGVTLTACTNLTYGSQMDKKIISLPTPDTSGKIPFETLIANRRSVRSFSEKPLTLAQIGQLLFSAQGITGKRGLRASPSAGALYPLELYVVNKDGLFHYIPKGHRLLRITEKDLRKPLQAAALSQSCVGKTGSDIVITAVYDRVTSKYGKRGIRYTDIEAGHAAQNIHLQALSLGLSSVPVGAFDDSKVASILHLPNNQTPLYIIPIGYSK
jgi:SagB-type dehydrogenase family enzyme